MYKITRASAIPRAMVGRGSLIIGKTLPAPKAGAEISLAFHNLFQNKVRLLLSAVQRRPDEPP